MAASQAPAKRAAGLRVSSGLLLLGKSSSNLDLESPITASCLAGGLPAQGAVGVDHSGVWEQGGDGAAEVIAQAQLPAVAAAPHVQVALLGHHAAVMLPAHHAHHRHALHPLHWRENQPPCGVARAQLAVCIVACRPPHSLPSAQHMPICDPQDSKVPARHHGQA
jgi:hypothetical protein